ncbi:MAG: FkbM family methyltransferase [Pseudomonadota bacterium]
MRLRRRDIRLRLLRKKTSLTYRGITVPIDHDVVPIEVVEQLADKNYEVPEIEASTVLLRPDDRVVELGSGMGVVSTLMSRAVPDGRVLTIEANPTLAPQIKQVHAANGVQNVDRWQGIVVAGEEPQPVEFHLHKFFPEGSVRRSSGSRDIIHVDAIPWSRVIGEFKPTVLICDIEGGETTLIPEIDTAGLRAIIVELHPGMISQTEIGQIFRKLLADGFVPRVDLQAGTVVAFERPE